MNGLREIYIYIFFKLILHPIFPRSFSVIASRLFDFLRTRSNSRNRGNILRETTANSMEKVAVFFCKIEEIGSAGFFLPVFCQAAAALIEPLTPPFNLSTLPVAVRFPSFSEWNGRFQAVESNPRRDLLE